MTDQIKQSSGAFTTKLYRGDGAVLLAFNVDDAHLDDLAGFAVQVTQPDGKQYWIQNRLNFDTGIHAGTTPQQRVWTDTKDAPLQTFRWAHFPTQIMPGTYQYQTYAVRFDGSGNPQLAETVTLPVDLTGDDFSNFELGFTRGYISSQAYASLFSNKPFGPQPPALSFDYSVYQDQWNWLGYHAYQMLQTFLTDAKNDLAAGKDVKLDALVYDFNQPDVLETLKGFGDRLRIHFDDASLHTGAKALEPQAATILQNAGAEVKKGHFQRFCHHKTIIKYLDGNPVQVFSGSANFSLRGFFVQANNCMIFDDADVCKLYSQVFNQTWDDPSGFTESSISTQWFPINNQNVPKMEFCFSPHKDSSLSLNKISDSIANANSSVLFAVMAFSGGGPVIEALKDTSEKSGVFSYGVTQSYDGDLNVHGPNNASGVLVPFAFLKDKVPPPFQAEFSGGMGQVIHDKFVVVDFNDTNPVVYTGSSNLAAGGEEQNGDNLVAIYDREIVTQFAVEAIRLVDHYEFRAAMKTATEVTPLQLQGPGSKWWGKFYDSTNPNYLERVLFVR